MNVPTERSASERMPVSIAAKRAARTCHASMLKWAADNGMTIAEAHARVRAQLNERIGG